MRVVAQEPGNELVGGSRVLSEFGPFYSCGLPEQNGPVRLGLTDIS